MPAKLLSRELDGPSADAPPKSSDDVEEFKISTSMFLEDLDAESEPSEKAATAPPPKKTIQTSLVFAPPVLSVPSKIENKEGI